MRLYLAGVETALNFKGCSAYVYENIDSFYFLSSFYYCKNSKKMNQFCSQVNKDNFLLDSGAFTFITHGKQNINIDEYTDDYIDFINKHDIKYFFEMDVDACYPLSKVLELRKKIERQTGKKCIPVFHRERGFNELKSIIENYDYIAIGGLVGNKDKDYFKEIKQIIRLCNKNNVKVHLLGYAKSDILDYNTYSADATSWIGNKFGGMWNWNIEKKRPEKVNRDLSKRVIASLHDNLALHNLRVWEQYQKYLKYQGFWRNK